MRTVATLAAILVLPCGLFGDDAPTPNLNIAIAAPAAEKQGESATTLPAGPATSGKYDTSVYQLKHVHARQIIPAVQRTICKHAAETAGEHAVVSVAFIPTTADDALVAVCRREYAVLVKQAVEECDVAKQYAVKVQLFEVTASGETVPVGSPSVVVGREGSVECKSASHGPITVSLQVSDSVTEPVDAAAFEPVATDLPEEANCCGPDCGQPALTSATTKAACPVSCSGQASETGVCPACKEAVSLGSSCGTCSGTCAVDTTTTSDCKCGASCKCKGTCKCDGKDKDQVAESSTESSACVGEKCESCTPSGEFTADEYRALVRILVSHCLQEHAARTDGVARDDAASPAACLCGPTCPAETSGAVAESNRQHRHLEFEVQLGCPAPLATTSAAPGCADQASGPGAAVCSDATVCPNDTVCPNATVLGTPAEEGLLLRRMRICASGIEDENDDVAVAHVTDSDTSSSCQSGCNGSCAGSSAEPPALLTLSPLKDGSPGFGILISPEWQAELSKKYQGRRLSEIFEVHNGQDSGAVALRGLLAVIAKPEPESANTTFHRRNVIVLDLADGVRVFDGKCDANSGSSGPCANCHDALRTLLGDVLQSPVPQSLNLVGHTDRDESVATSPRELPSISHSKIETTVVTYPLHDLILVDDNDHPVFDTCTIIDHIQAAVAPESWSHPSVSIQLDQQSKSLVIRQTAEVHKQIEAHLHDLRRLQARRLCKMIERLSAESESSDD
jgi:hypothetical protein